MNVIDALVVTLGLDNRDFKRGQQETDDDLKKTRERGKSTADSLEADGKRAAAYFKSLRNEVVGLFLAFAGASTLKDFASQIIAGDAATGRLASNLGIATEQLSAWEGAITRVGGKAGDADTALQAMVTAQQNLRLTGSTGHDADFQGLGITRNDLNDPANALLKMADAGERLGKPEFVARLQRIGIPESTINLLEKGRKGVTDMLAEQERLGVTTDADAKSAQAFQDALGKLETMLKGAARPAVEGLAGALADLENNGVKAIEDFPVLTGIVGALGVAAVGATGPWIALAGAIAAAMLAYRDWKRLQNMTPEERKNFDDEGVRLRAEAWDELKSGNTSGLFGTLWKGFTDRATGASSPAAAGAILGGAFGAISSRIRSSEGGKAGYDAVVYGLHSPHALTGMTLGEVYDYQRGALRAQTRGRRGPGDIGSTGVGAYQFESQTLAGNAAAIFGANWRMQAFSAANQDRIAEHLYNRVKGNPRALAQTWAVFGRPVAATRAAASGGGSPTTPGNTTIGPITINTAATDANGIARDLPAALRRRGLVIQAQSGMTK